MLPWRLSLRLFHDDEAGVQTSVSLAPAHLGVLSREMTGPNPAAPTSGWPGSVAS
jgi:hypothetical protein